MAGVTSGTATTVSTSTGADGGGSSSVGREDPPYGPTRPTPGEWGHRAGVEDGD